MLYIEIDSIDDFLNHVGSRRNLSFYAQCALFKYWKERAKSEDIKVSKDLIYGVQESYSAIEALAYRNHNDKLAELKKSIAEGLLDEDEAEKQAFNYLSSLYYSLCVRLKHGAVFIIP